MSRHEDQEVDPLDVDRGETKVDRYEKKEGCPENINTEDDDKTKETEEDNRNKKPSVDLSSPHGELKEGDASPPGDRFTIHAQNTPDSETEETKEIVEIEATDVHARPDVQTTVDEASVTSRIEVLSKGDGENTATADGHSDKKGTRDEAKPESKAKRDNWRQTKSQTEARKAKEMNGDSHHSPHGRNLTPAAPKKVADKVNSIIEDYTTKIRGASSRHETADKTPVRVGSFRVSESEPKGHISEIRARIERSASSAQSRPPTRRSNAGPGGARDAESIDEREGAAALEAKRKKKADEWLNKVVKHADGGSHGQPDRSGPLSPPGKAQANTWKKRELELKKEREEREATQKQLDERKKKLDEERRAREAVRKLKEQEDAPKREQPHSLVATTPTTTTERTSLSHHKYSNKEVEKTSQSPGIRSPPIAKSLSISSEDEKLKKQKAIEVRLRPLNLDGLDKDDLERKAHELHQRIKQLEEDKYDLEILLEKRESELNELKVKTGDAKGKFVKPLLKKVIKKEEVATHCMDDAAELRTNVNESKLKTATDEYHVTSMTNNDPADDRSDAIGHQEEVTNHQHPQPAVGQLQTAES